MRIPVININQQKKMAVEALLNIIRLSVGLAELGPPAINVYLIGGPSSARPDADR
jgi:hypothetical protein